MMKYVLITSTGKIMMFYVLNVAVMYKTIHGGNILIEDDFDNVEKIDEETE